MNLIGANFTTKAVVKSLASRVTETNLHRFAAERSNYGNTQLPVTRKQA